MHIVFSTLFSVFGYPTETLSLMFDILHFDLPDKNTSSQVLRATTWLNCTNKVIAVLSCQRNSGRLCVRQAQTQHTNHVTLMPYPHYPRGISKWKFNTKNTSYLFRPHYAGEILKPSNHQSKMYICNHLFIQSSVTTKNSQPR